MQTEFTIYINQLAYTCQSDKPIFTDLSLTFGLEKSGVIGKNGVGKSTLLKLIMGELIPQTGSITTRGKIAYCAQEFSIASSLTIADVLGVTEKITALQRIEQGSLEQQDFITLNDDWLIREKTAAQLSAFGLGYLTLEREFQSLSGGEQTRIRLTKIFLWDPDFIILDEPTNNLDNTARHFFYNVIAQWKKGLLIVSHDRELLNLMDRIIEITSVGVHVFGGNFNDYLIQKQTLTAAQERQLFDARKELSKSQHSIQGSREKHEKRQTKGRQLRKSGSQATIILDGMKERSTRSQGEMSTQHQRMLESAQQKLTAIKDKIEIPDEITLNLAKTFVPNGKMIVEMEDVNFSYPNSTTALIQDFNLKIQGPEHIAICGNNGSGKTTLIKLILKQLLPLQGKIYIGTPYVSYFDQHNTQLNPNLSVLANFLLLNPDANEHEAHEALAKFLFKNLAAHQLIKNLSGGEKLRALLACVLSAKHPPQLLILDEPTNHLDLVSIAKIETILKNFLGAMIIISHDQFFLKNIGISQYIYLSEDKYE